MKVIFTQDNRGKAILAKMVSQCLRLNELIVGTSYGIEWDSIGNICLMYNSRPPTKTYK